jgi:hypothetical protein
MALLLKQSTAVVISFGPFLDKTDGVTLETGLVSALDHASTGIMLSKNGGALAVRHATVTASSYDAHGCYRVTLDTTDTGTLGTLRIIYTDAATCLPVWQDCLVVTANIWDSLHSTDKLEVDAVQWLGTACATPTTNGVPEVDVTHIAGAAVSTSSAQLGVNVVQISGDATAADNLEAACDGNTYNVGGGAVVAASVTGAVGSVTGAVGSVTGAVGSVTAGVTLANDAITSAKFDESTAYPLTSADAGATAVARTGADSDTLETLSDQLDGCATGTNLGTVDTVVDAIKLVTDKVDTMLEEIP